MRYAHIFCGSSKRLKLNGSNRAVAVLGCALRRAPVARNAGILGPLCPWFSSVALRSLDHLGASFKQEWPLCRTHQLESFGNDANDVFSLKLGNYSRNSFDCQS
jgi:hypothetical protein